MKRKHEVAISLSFLKIILSFAMCHDLQNALMVM
jgi:hypothetical protein